MQFVNSYNKQIHCISIKQSVIFQKIAGYFVEFAQKTEQAQIFCRVSSCRKKYKEAGEKGADTRKRHFG